jgi:hypothetical protein
MWFYTATPQRCSGCGRADQMVRATTRRCPRCDGVDLSTVRRRPTAASPRNVAVAVSQVEQ